MDPRTNVDAIDFQLAELDGLRERLVIAFAYRAEQRSFELVTEWRGVPGSDRAFLRLAFEGVEQFAREGGVSARWQGFVASYSARGVVGDIVVQLAKSKPAGDRSAMALWFGPSFGGVSFSFRSVKAYLRSARARPLDGDWEYRDATSGERVDFYDPFAGA
jgi:hypothetical protein